MNVVTESLADKISVLIIIIGVLTLTLSVLLSGVKDKLDSIEHQLAAIAKNTSKKEQLEVANNDLPDI